MSSHTQARETGLIHFSLAEEIKDAFSRQQMSFRWHRFSEKRRAQCLAQ